MNPTTLPAEFRDLLDAQVAILATMGADGYPQVSALWFLADDDGTFKLSLNSARQKTKNLERDPEVTLFILDLANPRRYLEVRADAHYVTRAAGGRGAVREVIELILRCQGRWQRAVERYRGEKL